MNKIAIIGYGNVGYHFSNILSKSNQVSIFSRNPTEKEINNIASFSSENFDFIFLTVNDDAIQSVAESFSTTNSIVIHTSGSRPLSDLASHSKSAVIYPLQTLTKEKKVEPNSLQLFIESTPSSQNEITSLAESISPNVKYLTSADRGKIHLAAVFASNFSNHMFHIADHFLQDVDLTLDAIRPLIEETVRKAMELSPEKSQTGPAKRNDVSTLAYHENLIEDERIRELYQLITKSIQRFH